MVHRQSQDLEIDRHKWWLISVKKPPRDIVDRLMEPQTAVHFLEFCFSGILPNGKETALEKLNPDDMQYLHASPEGDEDGRPISERVMSRVGSVEDSDRLCLVVGKNIQSMKNRTCEGIIPLSEQRWKEKGLDQEDHFDIACQSRSAVVAAWEYLNQPRVAKNMRDTFHLLWGHWEELEVMINRQRMIDQEPPVSVTRLWLQFIVAHFQVVAERAHRWVIVHVNALRAPLLQRLAAHRPMNLDVVDSLQWKLTDRLHMLVEIASVADYAIMIPMHGYNGYTPPPIPPHILPALRDAHADWDLLTLLFQKAGQSGLEICPGREVVTEFGIGDGVPSEPGDFSGDRYSIALFNQPCKDALIQGAPEEVYPLVTGEEFNTPAMKRNFAALQETLKRKEAKWNLRAAIIAT
ncbi:hypothetical protein P175DRAFT_0528108 [Aspergillus ochraceoroseus IBT 24754]|uniref:Uncharacterized protein n=1 Tax=Aspergillus ochraceoroseus IBT 24754 TaxID=1392256 RepID=A0A2T5M7U8_9EURO|nr:uncharacterized protein P175DRAFT_0528108 [Aspergillus ochraceoroseus IBT 24754]PTU24611.1 hypothetical protein P175DRAFT_0528108 [Aspergillus ochraceoroseus IBT 24754]